jgi:integrase
VPRRNPVPTYLHHKPSGQAYVVIRAGGHRKDIYLGSYGSPESKAEYARLCRQLASSETAPAKIAAGKTAGLVNETIVAFLRYAPNYYRRPDGTPTNEVKEFRYACTHLSNLYGPEPAVEFDPPKLKLVRDSMIAAGWCRSRVNKQVNRLRLVFKWAAGEGMIPAAVADGLRVVAGLRKNRSDARETEPVAPAPPEHVEAVAPRMTPTLRDMVLLQRHSGMRPGEVRELIPVEVDTSGPVWVYRPGSVRPGGHKMDHLERDREVLIGPKGRAILAPRLAAAASSTERLFTPKRSKEEWWAMIRAARKSKVTPSQLSRRADPKTHQKRRREFWTDHGYAAAIRKACARAGVPPFAPNQLRHLFATEVRAKYGLEAAQVLLGHSRADVTQVYAERNRALAERVIAEAG